MGGDPILSIEEAAEILPLSKSSLYRAAKDGDGPFRKQRGRWMAAESKIREWVENGERGSRRPAESPMPRPSQPRRGSVLATVHELRRSAA